MKKILMLVVGGLALAGAGAGGAYWFWAGKAQAAGPAEHAEAAPAAPDPGDQGILPMDAFLVNLADQEASRFLRVTLRLVIGPKKVATHLAEDDVVKTRIRSAILEYLTTQTSHRLVTPDGKAELKAAIVERADHVLAEGKVVDVLFTEFVVQF